MHLFGLIGYPIAHSLSPAYMQSRWKKEGVKDCLYQLFPLHKIEEIKELPSQYPEICGLNVTSPFKEEVLAYADKIDSTAEALQSCNVLSIKQGQITAHNTDVVGFATLMDKLYGLHTMTRVDKNTITAMEQLSSTSHLQAPKKALVLGSGGAARAVRKVLETKNIECLLVSRKKEGKGFCHYDMLTESLIAAHLLIVNATPLGMGNLTDQAPDIPYQSLTDRHMLIDLNYLPAESLFLKKGKQQGAQVCNGLQMLYAQADASWSIWKKDLQTT